MEIIQLVTGFYSQYKIYGCTGVLKIEPHLVLGMRSLHYFAVHIMELSVLTAHCVSSISPVHVWSELKLKIAFPPSSLLSFVDCRARMS